MRRLPWYVATGHAIVHGYVHHHVLRSSGFQNGWFPEHTGADGCNHSSWPDLYVCYLHCGLYR